MKVKFVSFYTPRYKDHAMRLIASLDKYGVDFDVVKLDEEFDEGHTDSKFLNAVRYKPKFILDMCEKYSDYDGVVWVDADAELVNGPALLYKIDADVGLRYRECFELVAATMFWRPSYKVMRFLKKWVSFMENPTTFELPCPEQQVLQELISQGGLEVYRLPEEYGYIAPMEGQDENFLREKNNLGRFVSPVIYQHQASREMRNA